MEFELYTVQDLSKLFKCPETAIYKLVRNKKIKFLKIGKGYKFTEKAIEEYLNTNDEIVFRPTILVMQKKRGRKTN